jgi:putative acetyltransferase
MQAGQTVIRYYKSKDATSLADLYVRSVKQIGCRYYSPQQVEAWASLAPSPERLEELSMDGRKRFVAVDGSDQPIAFADLEQDGYIHLLYCAPESAGKGVASTLYHELERTARELGMNRLYSEASEAARGFFLKQGFVVLAKRQFEIFSIPIHNYAVEKILSI